MRAAKVLALLLAVSVAHFVQVDADEFDDTDDGVTVEVEKVSFMFFFFSSVQTKRGNLKR